MEEDAGSSSKDLGLERECFIDEARAALARAVNERRGDVVGLQMLSNFQFSDSMRLGCEAMAVGAAMGGAAVDAGLRHVNELRVLGSYGATLGRLCKGHTFLRGATASCAHGLEAFAGLVGPLQRPEGEALHCAEQLLAAFVSKRGGAGMSRLEGLFKLQSNLALQDRDVTRLLLAESFPGDSSLREFDVDVCGVMVDGGLSYGEWAQEFPAWRSRGLHYVLGVAGRVMPRAADWLGGGSAVDLSESAAAVAFMDLVGRAAGGARPGTLAEEVARVSSAWHADESGTGAALAGTLDRAAILMRVKSNGADVGYSLDRALEGFPSFRGASAGASAFGVWHGIKSALEQSMPPCVLCKEYMRRARPRTWALPRLTLEVQGADRGAIGMAQRRLEPVSVESWRGGSHAWAEASGCQSAGRVLDLVARIGTLVLSPDMCSAMAHGAGCLPRLGMGMSLRATALRDEMLSGSRSLRAGASDFDAREEAFGGHVAGLEGFAPSVRVEEVPLSSRWLLMWRVDVPSRPIVYRGLEGGKEAGHRDFVLDSRAKSVCGGGRMLTRTLGGVMGSPVAATLQTVRAVVRHAGHEALGRAGIHAGTGNAQTTTWAETLACFGLTDAGKTTELACGPPRPRWSESTIDLRYAETQLATNGSRFRDWVTLHVDGAQQGRLAAHAVCVSKLHHTAMPWIVDGGALRWVRVASSLHMEASILRGPTLRQAVESRFMQDPRLLPVAEEGHWVVRDNAELYEAREPGTVGIAYAPVWEGQGSKEASTLHVALFSEMGSHGGRI